MFHIFIVVFSGFFLDFFCFSCLVGTLLYHYLLPMKNLFLLHDTEPPRSSPQQDQGAVGSGNGPPVPPLIDPGNAITYTDDFSNVAADNSTIRELPTVS